MCWPIDPQLIIMDFEQSEPAPVLLLIPVLVLNHSKLEMFIRSHIIFCSERCAFQISAAAVSVVELSMMIVKLRQGSGKDGQGMALKAKGLKA